MTSQIIDNRTSEHVLDVLQKNIEPETDLSLLLNRISLNGFDALRTQLEKSHTRLLLARDADENIAQSLSGNEVENRLKNQLIQKELAASFLHWLNSLQEVKGIDASRIPQNLYHIKNSPEEQFFVQGSSPLTAAGLGIIHSDRIDMNMAGNDLNQSEQMLQWFESIWTDEFATYDLKEQLIEAAQNLAEDKSPEFIYFLTLYRLFTDLLEELDEEEIIKTKTGFKDSAVWNKLYKFQRDGVLGTIDKLERFNGCILADSVGLGKTFEGLAVIKYYELRNDRVLVLAPKKLRENWTLYTKNDKRNLLAKDRFSYDVLNHTDLTREKGMSGDINLETINWGNYDLIVIDESHNFRNASSAKDRHTRYSKLMDDVIRSGVKTKVLMLSATPVNNRLNDLKNQVAFITEGNDFALVDKGINNISGTIKRAQTRFNEWLKLPEEKRTSDTLLSSLNFDYFKVLDLLTIARSRKHIEKYYNLDEIGQFPERLKPINIKADFDTQLEFPALKEINRTIGRLNLSTFAPLKYVEVHKRKEYEEKYDTVLKDGQSVFSQLDREKSLIGLIKINMLKRLESSIHSFRLTTKRLLQSVEDLITKLEQHQLNEIGELNILETDIDSPELEALLVGKKVKVLMQDMDQSKWMYDLKEDKDYLITLVNAANAITAERDQKLQLLKQRITDKIETPLNEGNKKVVVFTAFADTAEYLYQNIAMWAKDKFNIHSGLVIGSGANKITNPLLRNELNEMLTAFSPISKERDKTGMSDEATLDIIIATDCISEGQNLQDCDYVINYDIHWNPVRIIQRFGRIDRLGSKNDRIQLVNFWPNMELDEYIDLESRVSGRMVLLDVSATGEENIIASDNPNRMRDLEYRRKQLKQLQDTVLDLEEIAGGLSITDLTLNDFKMDLSNYMQNHKDALENAPTGLYSVVKLDENLKSDGMQSGVILCVKNLEKKVSAGKAPVEEAYALYPYFLVYVSTDESVVYPYTQAKKTMDLLKKHCLGLSHPDAGIYQTAPESSKYQPHLKAATDHIQGKVEETGLKSLFSRGGTNISKALDMNDNFEVISYLILLD